MAIVRKVLTGLARSPINVTNGVTRCRARERLADYGPLALILLENRPEIGPTNPRSYEYADKLVQDAASFERFIARSQVSPPSGIGLHITCRLLRQGQMRSDLTQLKSRRLFEGQIDNYSLL